MTTKVVHCRRSKYDVLIDRSTPWGNPHKISPTCSRDQSVSRFRNDLKYNQHPKFQWMRDNLHTLKGKRIGCWCSPLPCHGDVLAKEADKL